MSRVLVIAGHDGYRLDAATANTIRCAVQIADARAEVAVFADDGTEVAREVARLTGVHRVLLVRNLENRYPLAAILVPQIVAIAAGYTHLLAPATSFGKDLMPGVAALIGVAQISDVRRVLSPHLFQRTIYAGNVVVDVEAPEDRTVVATVRPSSFEAVEECDDAAEIEILTPAVDLPKHTRFVELRAMKGGRPDLRTASRIVAGGRGLGGSEQFDLVNRLADRLGAAVGASRAAVDAGYVGNNLQVGQTGAIVAPELYIALGISGALQHTAGIKDAGTIVAVNKDPTAPIFDIADIGMVGDVLQVVPEMIQALE